jgi:hypothetical protein
MPGIDDENFRERIKMALMDYQNKKISEGKRISSQRQKDLRIIYHYVETFMDTTQLELQIVDYIKKMPQAHSWRSWLFWQNEESVLKTMLENILWDENCQRMRYGFFSREGQLQNISETNMPTSSTNNVSLGPWQPLQDYPLLTQGEL